MAKPINHDLGSATATTAWSAVKGGLLGVVTAGIVGGLLAGGAIALIGTVGIGLGSLLVGGAFEASMFSGLGGLMTAIGAGVGALAGVTGSTIPAAIFGGVGALAGAQKVHKENVAFRNRVMDASHTHEIAQNNAAMAGMQHGYLMGAQETAPRAFQQGQAYQEDYMINQLRAAQQKALMDHALKAKGGHVTKVCKEREAVQTAVMTPAG